MKYLAYCIFVAGMAAAAYGFVLVPACRELTAAVASIDYTQVADPD